MAITGVSVRPETASTVYLNMNKIMKHVKSKPGLEAAKRYEDNLRLIDYWHPKDAMAVKEAANESLEKVVNNLFSKLSAYERTAIVAQIKFEIASKIRNAMKILNETGLYNVGQAGDGVLQCAMERDKQLDIVKAIYREARDKGQTKLNTEQQKAVELAKKQAEAYDKRRCDFVEAKRDAIAENERVVREKGPEVLKAYKYLFEMPESFVRK